jgi:hypothetical protein
MIIVVHARVAMAVRLARVSRHANCACHRMRQIVRSTPREPKGARGAFCMILHSFCSVCTLIRRYS